MKKTITIIAVVVVAVLLIGSKVFSKPTEWEEYTVKSGDSINGIARDITPNNKDYRFAVYDIIEENNIEDCTIYPGQTILVPVIE